MADTVNKRVPRRRYSRPYEITLSDVTTDENLKRNGVPYLFLQNLGASGVCAIVWDDGTEVTVGLAQHQLIELGLPKHLKTTGTTAGGPFRGFLGMGDII